MSLHGSIVLLVLTALWAASQVSEADGCCIFVTNHRVSMRDVKDYYEDNTVHGSCVKAIVLIFKDGRSICVSPDARWIPNIKRRIDDRKRMLDVSPED